VVFGATYEAEHPTEHDALRSATQLRNDLIHNSLTAPDPTEAEVDAALTTVDDYWAWLDSRSP